MKAVWIESGVVTNISVWDELSTIPPGVNIKVVDDSVYVGIGFIYDGSGYIQVPGSE